MKAGNLVRWVAAMDRRTRIGLVTVIAIGAAVLAVAMAWKLMSPSSKATVVAPVATPTATVEPAPTPMPTPNETVAAPVDTNTTPAEPASTWNADGPWVKMSPPSADDRVEIEALNADEAGVDKTSAFRLTTSLAVDEQALLDGLTVQPPIEVTLAKVAAGSFLLTPKSGLSGETLYQFALKLPGPEAFSGSWAFQTKGPPRVVQSLPADAATGVPLNTGIELTFNCDGVEDAGPYFEIEPATTGRLEVHKRTLVFVPDALRPFTLYTVRLREGLGIVGSDEVMSEPFEFQFETGNIDRSGSPSYGPWFGFVRRMNEMPVEGDQVISVYGFSGPVDVTLYRYESFSDFVDAVRKYDSLPIWATATRSQYVVDCSAMTPYATSQMTSESLEGETYLRFGQLGKGFYLLEAVSGDYKAQAWLQVTNLAPYVALSETESLVWLNDVSTQEPVEGARVTLADETQLATTDNDGLASFATPELHKQRKAAGSGQQTLASSEGLIVTARNGSQAYVPASSVQMRYGYNYGGSTYVSEPDLYWRYVQTNRPLYLPDDTVRFWGVAKKREGGSSDGQATVELWSGYGYYDYSGSGTGQAPLATVKAPLSPAGTFSGEIPLKSLATGYYRLTVSVDGVEVTSGGVQVQTYTKPAYKIDVKPSKRAALVGDTVDFTIQTSFFDGSPMPNVDLRVQGATGSSSLRTDLTGTATVQQVATAQSNYPGSLSVSAMPATQEEGEINGHGSAIVFPSELALEAQGTRDGNKAKVEGTVRYVDVAGLNADPNRDRWDYLGGVAAGRQVKLSVTEVWSEATVTGNEYDFIQKKTVPVYTYSQQSKPLGDFQTTTDASGQYSVEFPASTDHQLRIQITTVDDGGRTASLETGAYQYSPGGYYGANIRDLGQQKEGFDRWWSGGSQYDAGDEVALGFFWGNDLAPEGGANRFLFERAQNGIREYSLSDSPEWRFEFRAEFAPSVTVQGVWFSGQTYEAITYGPTLRYNPAPQRLKVELSADKERYLPGETATVTVSVHDAEGQPVSAEVNLSAVDEAIYRTEYSFFSYGSDLVQSLYTSVGSGIFMTYASHQYPVFNGGGPPAVTAPATGPGTGGSGGGRSDFRDTALFENVKTDAEGRGSVTFKLPDNLTSWRVMANALTGDMKAGNGMEMVPVGLPFFVDATMNTEYVVVDRPSIRLRAFGLEVAGGAPVTFMVSAPSLSSEMATVEGTALQPVYVPLPPLSVGEHEVVITARSGEHSDTLIRKINVVESRLVASESQFYSLTDGLQIEGAASGRTKVVFSDENRGRYYPALQSLSWTWGDRVDQMTARNVAQSLLTQYFGEDWARPAEFNREAYVTNRGGIALLPYADADLTLSANLAAVAGDSFGRNALLDYFRTIADDPQETRERTIIALYGLATLGEPVLQEVRALSATGNLTWRERVYSALALLAIGDEPGAAAMYRALVSDFGQSNAPVARLLVSEDQDDVLEATSLVAILAAGLGDSNAPAFFEYTLRNKAEDLLVQPQQVAFLKEALPRLSEEPVLFSYWLAGERHEQVLQKGRTFSLSLLPEEMPSLQPKALEGSVGVASLFLTPLDQNTAKTDPLISVSRRYELAAEDGSFDGLVRVVLDYTLSPQALDGCYQVTDLLPSGLRAVVNASSWEQAANDNQRWYPYSIEGQRVSFCASKARTGPIVYYARVIGPGDYVAEPATIQSMQSTVSFNLSQGQVVVTR